MEIKTDIKTDMPAKHRVDIKIEETIDPSQPGPENGTLVAVEHRRTVVCEDGVESGKVKVNPNDLLELVTNLCISTILMSDDEDDTKVKAALSVARGIIQSVLGAVGGEAEVEAEMADLKEVLTDEQKQSLALTLSNPNFKLTPN